MKFCNKFLIPFVLINIFFSLHSVAQTTDDLEKMIRGSKTRAALVQNVQKAVVHIKVEKIFSTVCSHKHFLFSSFSSTNH